jgi:hypothetical protein
MARIDAALSGVFAEGWTEESVNRVLGPMSWEYGIRLVAVWDLVEDDSAGGETELGGFGSDGRIYELSAPLYAFLCDGEPSGDLVIDALIDRRAPVEKAAGRKPLVEIDGHNLAVTDKRSKRRKR